MTSIRYLFVASVLVFGVLCAAIPSVMLVLFLLYVTPLIWVMRSLVARRTSPVVDAAISLLSILVFFRTLALGPVFAFWCFLLVQGLTLFVPRSFKKRPKPERFTSAEMLARRAIDRLEARFNAG